MRCPIVIQCIKLACLSSGNQHSTSPMCLILQTVVCVVNLELRLANSLIKKLSLSQIETVRCWLWAHTERGTSGSEACYDEACCNEAARRLRQGIHDAALQTVGICWFSRRRIAAVRHPAEWTRKVEGTQSWSSSASRLPTGCCWLRSL